MKQKRKTIIIIVVIAVVALIALYYAVFRTGKRYSARLTADAGAISAALKSSCTPGIYTAVAQGRNGDISVTMTFSEDSIVAIEIVSERETRFIGRKAVEGLAPAILAGQSSDVDAITGATITSDAIKAATEDCIAQAARNKYLNRGVCL
jgi:uncharacterized protein with FMN-binding domain